MFLNFPWIKDPRTTIQLRQVHLTETNNWQPKWEQDVVINPNQDFSIPFHSVDADADSSSGTDDDRDSRIENLKRLTTSVGQHSFSSSISDPYMKTYSSSRLRKSSQDTELLQSMEPSPVPSSVGAGSSSMSDYSHYTPTIVPSMTPSSGPSPVISEPGTAAAPSCDRQMSDYFAHAQATLPLAGHGMSSMPFTHAMSISRDVSWILLGLGKLFFFFFFF